MVFPHPTFVIFIMTSSENALLSVFDFEQPLHSFFLYARLKNRTYYVTGSGVRPLDCLSVNFSFPAYFYSYI